MRRPDDEYVPSHQQMRRRLSSQEDNLKAWMVRLVVLLLVLAGLLVAYWTQRVVGGRSISSLKEEAKKEIFDEINQKDSITHE